MMQPTTTTSPTRFAKPPYIRPAATDVGTTDPLIGTQEETDDPVEARRAPLAEVVLHQQPHGRAIKSRRTAAALGVLLGGLGAHRFYLGYNRIGALQAVIFGGGVLAYTAIAIAAGVPTVPAILGGIACFAFIALWGLFEGVAIYLGMLDHDAQGHPLTT
jgi:TM2 domain-containing membrane protein YozV